MQVTSNRKSHFENLCRRTQALCEQGIADVCQQILLHSSFRRLASRWTSLSWLIEAVVSDKDTMVKIFSFSQDEFIQDITTASEWQYSTVAKRLIAQEYDMPGGLPYSLLCLEYSFNIAKRRDCHSLRLLATLVSSIELPCLCNISPENLTSDKSLSPLTDWQQHFEQTHFASFHELNNFQYRHFLTLLFPSVNMSMPRCHSPHAWFTSLAPPSLTLKASLFVTKIMLNRFTRFGWFTLENETELTLPSIANLNQPPFIEQHISTWLLPTDSHTLSGYRVDTLIQPMGQSTLKVQLCAGPSRKPSLAEILCLNRFAHTLKVLLREKVGQYFDEESCEKMLSRWLNHFCANAYSSQYPLKSAIVRVHTVTEEITHYVCHIALILHERASQSPHNITLEHSQ